MYQIASWNGLNNHHANMPILAKLIASLYLNYSREFTDRHAAVVGDRNYPNYRTARSSANLEWNRQQFCWVILFVHTFFRATSVKRIFSAHNCALSLVIAA